MVQGLGVKGLGIQALGLPKVGILDKLVWEECSSAVASKIATIL